MLTQARLKEVLDYDPETGLFRWKVRPNNFVRVGGQAGSLGPCGYLRLFISRKSYKAHRLAFLWMTGEWPEQETDHMARNAYTIADAMIKARMQS